jgi:hypothetical protein
MPHILARVDIRGGLFRTSPEIAEHRLSGGAPPPPTNSGTTHGAVELARTMGGLRQDRLGASTRGSRPPGREPLLFILRAAHAPSEPYPAIRVIPTTEPALQYPQQKLVHGGHSNGQVAHVGERLFLEDPAAERYEQVFGQLADAALTSAESSEFIADMVAAVS